MSPYAKAVPRAVKTLRRTVNVGLFQPGAGSPVQKISYFPGVFAKNG
jgi:hypothetical protein